MTASQRLVLKLSVAAGLALCATSAASQTVTAPRFDSATLRTRLAPTMDPPGRPQPADAPALDAMLRAKEIGPLTARLRSAHTAQDVGLDLNWEQTQVYRGAGFIVAYAYMYDLWRVGASTPGAAGDDMKNSAGMMFVYALDLVAVDGSRCADASAPGHRRDQLFAQNAPLVAYLRTLPAATRMTLGTVSLDIESATSPLRGPDEVLCSGGVEEISEGLKAQGQAPLQPVPNAPGTYGKTYAVPPAPGYAPRFVDEGTWRAKQAQARQSLPASLTRLLSLPGDASGK